MAPHKIFHSLIAKENDFWLESAQTYCNKMFSRYISYFAILIAHLWIIRRAFTVAPSRGLFLCDKIFQVNGLFLPSWSEWKRSSSEMSQNRVQSASLPYTICSGFWCLVQFFSPADRCRVHFFPGSEMPGTIFFPVCKFF